MPVNVRPQEYKVFMETVVLERFTGFFGCTEHRLMLLYLIPIIAPEILEGVIDLFQGILEVCILEFCIFEVGVCRDRILRSVDHCMEMKKPFGNCIVLKSKVAAECKLAQYIFVDLTIEALKSKILQAKGS